MTALFIVNPLSQRVAQKGSRLSPYAQPCGAQIYEINNFKNLANVVVNAAKSRVKYVFIEGGDGTAQGVLSAFLQQSDIFPTFPDFAIIAGGMTNQVAKNIGLKPSLVKAALAGELRLKPMPLLNVEISDGNVYNGFLFSTGAVPMVTDYTKSKLHKRGIGGSFAVAGGILKGISANNDEVLYPTEISVTCESANIDIQTAHIGTILTTLPSLIMGLDPFWGSREAPLRLTYVGENPRRLYRNIISLWRGNKTKDRSQDGLQSWNIDHVNYQYNGPCVLDGEPLMMADGIFRITPTRPINFIQAQ
ncbi:MAG: diacylglycerol kinase family protein [Litorimonas sp.]